MAGWLFVLLVAVAVGAVSAVLLVVLAAVGSSLRLSSGPVVVSARAVAVVLLLAVLVALGSGLWGSVAGMLAAWR